MVLLDSLVLLVFSFSIVISIYRGLVREILSLISWAMIAVCLIYALEPLSAQLLIYDVKSPLNWILSLLLILLSVWVLTLFISRCLRFFLKGLGLGWLDSLLGAVFGILRGLVLAWLIIWISILVLGPDHNYITEAAAPNFVHNSDEYLAAFVVKNDTVQEYYLLFKEAVSKLSY